MSNELQKLTGSNGSDIVGAETFTPPSGFVIYSVIPRVNGARITGWKELEAYGTESENEKTVSSDSKIGIDLVNGEYLTFRNPLSEITCNTAGGITVYYQAR